MIKKKLTITSTKKVEIKEKEEYLAALDIGSNSFHFVMARQVGEHLQIVHTEKYRVQLANGLDKKNNLSKEAIDRGVSTLAHLATTTQHIHSNNFRVVATYTLRRAKNAAQLLKSAKNVFPFKIEIISGHEEARLIYQGVAHHTQNDTKQLVIDIGGGSTECIIGEKYDIRGLDSLNMGCVNFQQEFFPNNDISKNAFKLAIRHAKHKIDAIAKRFKTIGWQKVIGTSGTIKAITKAINADAEVNNKPITLNELYQLKDLLIEFGKVEAIDIVNIKKSRQSVICSGLAILIALMESLEIENIEFCKYALREGVLFEQREMLQHNNIRKLTIDNFLHRFNVDTHHANTVLNSAKKILNWVCLPWQLAAPIYKELLYSAIRLHEIGMDINTSGYQKHGQYILEQADLAGFNQEQQKALAWLVGSQRKKIAILNADEWYLLSKTKLLRLCIIMRLSVLLNQQRHADDSFLIDVAANKKTLILTLNKQWLKERPIIETELFYEQNLISKLAFNLLVETQ